MTPHDVPAAAEQLVDFHERFASLFARQAQGDFDGGSPSNVFDVSRLIEDEERSVREALRHGARDKMGCGSARIEDEDLRGSERGGQIEAALRRKCVRAGAEMNHPIGPGTTPERVLIHLAPHLRESGYTIGVLYGSPGVGCGTQERLRTRDYDQKRLQGEIA